MGTPVSQIASRAATHGIGTAMLEHIGADYNELHEDLKVANNIAWQQFALAFPETDNGAQFYTIGGTSSNPTVNIGSRTKFLRQYFKFVRAGARRIGASTTNTNFDPVAFINADGKYSVVTKASASGNFSIQNLPAGTYGIVYTTSSQYNISLSDQIISAGQSLVTSIPASGVITIYAKSTGGSPPPPPTFRKGDLNKDGKVDTTDAFRLLTRWGSSSSADLLEADINGPSGSPDGKIDIYDANKLMADWTG